jgi:hypothetical protein
MRGGNPGRTASGGSARADSADMNNPNLPSCYRAVSMEFAAHLDGQFVAMHIVTDTGETISVACPRDSIFEVQRQIERLGRECPDIATWARGNGPTRAQSGSSARSAKAK